MQGVNASKLLRGLLRVTSGTTDDPDYAGSSRVVFPVDADATYLKHPSSSSIDPVHLKVEVLLEWLAADDTVVVGNRGLHDIQAIRVVERRAPLTGKMCVDSVKLLRQISNRPVVIDDPMVGDKFTVRLSAMTVPLGATKARVLLREIV